MKVLNEGKKRQGDDGRVTHGGQTAVQQTAAQILQRDPTDLEAGRFAAPIVAARHILHAEKVVHLRVPPRIGDVTAQIGPVRSGVASCLA